MDRPLYPKDFKKIMDKKNQKRKLEHQIKALTILEWIVIPIILALIAITAYFYFKPTESIVSEIPNATEKVQIKNI